MTLTVWIIVIRCNGVYKYTDLLKVIILLLVLTLIANYFQL